MQHNEKVELIQLLNQYKRILPPVEERGIYTTHYARVEKRIDKAISKLKDEDFKYIQAVNSKLLELQLEGEITMEEYMQLSKMDPE